MSSRANPPDSRPAEIGGAAESAALQANPPLPHVPAPDSASPGWLARTGAGAGSAAAMVAALLRHRHWRRIGKILLRTALALLVCAIGAVMLIRFVLWPEASSARGWIETRGSAAMQGTLTIGALDTYWEGWHPALKARDVRIVDAKQRVLLSAAEVDAMLSWQSLTHLDLRFARFATRQTELLAQRTADGKFLVAGQPLASDTTTQDDRFLDWLMAQGSIDLADGKLRWLDEQRALPPLEVGNIHLTAQRAGTRHTVRLEAEASSLSPRPIVIEAAFRHDYLHRAGDWRHWRGHATLDVSQMQLPALQLYAPVFAQVERGALSADGTAEFAGGRITQSQLRLRGTDLELLLAGATDPLRLASVQTLLMHRSPKARENKVTIDTLLWKTARDAAAGAADGPGQEGIRKLTLGWTTDSRDALRAFSAEAPTLDLSAMRALAAFLPLPASVTTKLRERQPAGRIDNLDVRWSQAQTGLIEPRAAAPQYHVRGILRDVSIREVAAGPANTQPAAQGVAPQVNRPGFSGLSGNFSFDEKTGQAHFDSENTAIILPGVFEDPQLRFDQLGGDLRWERQDGKLRVKLNNIRFANPDAAGTLEGSWQEGGDGHDGIADLRGELTRALVNRVPRYLPLTLPAHSRHYLAGALVAGDARGVKFVLKGDLAHFPFQPRADKAGAKSGGKPDPKADAAARAIAAGEFRVDVPVSQVAYQVAPQVAAASGSPRWPTFTDISGVVTFDRGSMSFLAQRAAVHDIPGVTLHDVSGRIPDLDDHAAHLAIDGSATGALPGFLRYLAASPVGEWIGGITADARGQGNAELKLKLDMPLDHADGSRVQGQFRLAGNDIVPMARFPALSGATGTIAFDEHGFQLDNVRARWLGGELRTAGGTQADGSTHVTATGTVTSRGAGEALAGTQLASLAQQMDGTTGFAAVIAIQDKQPRISVSSELTGMALSLPAPMTKTAAQSVPLRVEMRPAPGRADVNEVSVQYGTLLQARYLMRPGANGAAVLAGGIGIQQAAPAPASGVVAAGTLDHFDLDAWRTVLKRIDARADSRPDAPDPRRDGDGRHGPTDAFLPERITARARTLHAFGRDLDDVSIDATRTRTPAGGGERGADGWQMTIGSKQIAGNIRWRADTADNTAGSVALRLTRLSVPDTRDEGHVADALADNIDELPAIDLVADHFELHGRDFGKLEVQARTNTVDGEPAWTLEKLVIDQPGATLTSSGSWRVPRRLRENADAARRTQLAFTLDVRNAGDVLERFGMAHTLRDGKGKIEGRIGWFGSPMSIDYPSLSGQVSLKMENGHILAVEPGAAKFLGVLSLQSLMRLATFDFRGISGGVVFDSVTGTGAIAQGIATTSDFQMKAGQFTATMTGSANIPQETQDLAVSVVPRINAASASVAAAFINPVLGIGTLAAQLLFADEFSKAFTQHYRITGSWADPKIGKVEENASRPLLKAGERQAAPN